MILSIFLGFAVFTVGYYFLSHPKTQNYAGKHVAIVGGSEGIGKALALQLVKLGAKVSIFARNTGKLEQAKKEIVQSVGGEDSAKIVDYFTMDITKKESILPAFKDAEKSIGPIDVLIIAAGQSKPGYILEQNEEAFQSQMNLNYFGAINCAKSLLPSFLNSDLPKQILFVGSTCSILSFIGYGSYAPSKYAVKAFADTLRQELSFSKIKICLALPPDTKTPGFQEENKTKPKENLAVFENLNEVFETEVVASCVLDGLIRNEYLILGPDFGQNLLAGHMAGLTSRNRLLPLNIVLSPFIDVVFVCLRWHSDRISQKFNYWEKLK